MDDLLNKLVIFLNKKEHDKAEKLLLEFLQQLVQTYTARQVTTMVINPKLNKDFGQAFRLTNLFAFSFDSVFKNQIALNTQELDVDFAENNNKLLLQCCQSPHQMDTLIKSSYFLLSNLTQPFLVRYFTQDDHIKLVDNLLRYQGLVENN